MRSPDHAPTALPSDLGMRMLAELEDAARLERSRLADVVHDDALQLVAVARQNALERLPDTEDRRALVDLLGEAVRALRSVVASADEEALDDLPLRDALERLGTTIGGRARFAVTVRTEGDVDGIHDVAVRGWARELLVNAAKHAAASTVDVLVRATPETVEVVVRDDGVGPDEAQVFASAVGGHLGLRRLERAADLLGGTFSLRREGERTVARVRMPRAALAGQRRTEHDLGSERRWSAGLVAALRDALLVVRRGSVVQANEAVAVLTGFPTAAIVGTAVPDVAFWADADRDANALAFARARARDGGEARIRMTRADGSSFNALWAVQRIDDGVGGGVGTLVVVRDLTEQERAVERAQLRTELAATIETTGRLASLLQAARSGPHAVYAALGGLLIDHLGWRDVAVNVRRGAEWVVEWTSDEAADLLGERYARDSFAPFLADRFDRGGVFCSYEEDGLCAPGRDVVIGDRDPVGPDDLRPGDALFVPVPDREGRVRAIVSVDRPRSGKRPTATELRALAAIATHVGLAYELLDGAGAVAPPVAAGTTPGARFPS